MTCEYDTFMILIFASFLFLAVGIVGLGISIGAIRKKLEEHA